MEGCARLAGNSFWGAVKRGDKAPRSFFVHLEARVLDGVVTDRWSYADFPELLKNTKYRATKKAGSGQRDSDSCSDSSTDSDDDVEYTPRYVLVGIGTGSPSATNGHYGHYVRLRDASGAFSWYRGDGMISDGIRSRVTEPFTHRRRYAADTSRAGTPRRVQDVTVSGFR